MRCIALACVLTLPVFAQKSHVDSIRGFKFDPPAGWVALPAGGDRGSQIGIWMGPRAMATKAGADVFPVLRVLWFPKEVKDQGPDEIEGLPQLTPYKNFDDYVARGHSKDTKLVSRDKQDIGKMPGELVQVLVVRKRGDLELYGARLPLEDGELWIEIAASAEHHEKVIKPLAKLFDTVAPVPRDTKPVAAVDADWKPFKSARFKIVSRAEAKLTTRVVEAAEAARDWVEKRFKSLHAKPPEPVVLRIFANPAELAVFREREPIRRDFDPARMEILTAADADAGKAGDVFGSLIQGVLVHWLHTADPMIPEYLPRWLDHGMQYYIENSQVAGKSIKFLVSDNEAARMRAQQQRNTMPAIWHLIQESIVETPSDGKDEEPFEYPYECARVIRWVEAGNGKLLGADDFFVHYWRAVGKAATAKGHNPVRNVNLARLTDSQRGTYNKKYYEYRDALCKAINDLAVPLQEEPWRKANEAWLEWNKKFKG